MLFQSCYTPHLSASCCHHKNTALWAIPTAIMGSLACYCGFKWFHSPVKNNPHENYTTTLLPLEQSTQKKDAPTLGIVKKYVEEKKALTMSLDIGSSIVHATSDTPTPPDNDLYWLVSPGFMGHRPQNCSQEPEPQSGIEQAAAFIRGNIIHGPCITFNYNDDRRTFNFAQDDDLLLLHNAYKKIPATSDVILVGTCRGATALLNFLPKLPEKEYQRIKAVILESPALSLKSLAQKVGQTYVNWLPKSPQLIHTFFRFWFPNYDPTYPDCMNSLACIPKDLPIFIGHLKDDKVIEESDIIALKNRFIETGHINTHFAIIEDTTHTITHARMSKIPAFQYEVNKFLQQYHLPHDEQCAQKAQFK